jgi:hypothetical protein
MICYLNVHVCICVDVLVRPHGVNAWYIYSVYDVKDAFWKVEFGQY